MNSAERVMFYATALEQEAPHELPDKEPPKTWPADGRVELKDIVFSYRPGLPPVLKGITMTVDAGEKIGIVGRYLEETFVGVEVAESCIDVELVLGRVTMMMGMLSIFLRRFLGC